MFLIAESAINSPAIGKKHSAFGYLFNNDMCASCPPRTAPQCVHALGCKLIHCNRSTIRLATSSCSHGVAAGAVRCQYAAALGEIVGGRSVGMQISGKLCFSRLLEAMYRVYWTLCFANYFVLGHKNCSTVSLANVRFANLGQPVVWSVSHASHDLRSQ